MLRIETNESGTEVPVATTYDTSSVIIPSTSVLWRSLTVEKYNSSM